MPNNVIYCLHIQPRKNGEGQYLLYSVWYCEMIYQIQAHLPQR